jgi:hypothetical protein
LLQATNQGLVAASIGIQSQQCERSVKEGKERATRRQAKGKKVRQHAIDVEGVAFIAIENCAICKMKHLNARGIKRRVPKRSHRKALQG